MAANISFNPSLMTQPQNSFLLESQGYIQGLTADDPVSRMFLLAGMVGSAVTVPVWGGMGIAVNVGGLSSAGMPNQTVVPAITTQLNGFTVFDQAINMTQIPGNSVPVSVAGQNVAYYTFGSNARIALPVASGSFAALETDPIGAQLYWDTTAYNLTTTSSGPTVALPTSVKVLAVDNNSRAVSYNSGTGAVTWLEGQDMALIMI